MRKFTTEERPFSALRPGDLIGTSYGYVTLRRVTEGADGRYTLDLIGQESATYHPSNWRDVATGFTTEYRHAYPNETFRAATLTPCPACGVPYDAARIGPVRVPLSIRCACCCQ